MTTQTDGLPTPTGPCDFCGGEKQLSRINDPFDMEIHSRYTIKNICHDCYFARVENVARERGIPWKRKTL